MVKDISPIFECKLIITQNCKGKPSIEIRMQTSKSTDMEHLISAAYYETPIIVFPKFKNKFEALNKLQEKKLIYRDSDSEGNSQYYFSK